MAGAYFTEGKFLVHISFFLVARFWPEIEHVALLCFSVLRLLCLCAFCLYVSFGHLLGKGCPLGSRLWCLTMSLSLSHWYPGSGVVLIISIPDLYTLTYPERFSQLWPIIIHGLGTCSHILTALARN